MSNITLVRPPLLVATWSDAGPLTPPIGPAYLAASLRAAGHRPRIVDALGENPFQVTPLFDGKVQAIGLRAEEIVERLDPEATVIGFSCMFSQDWPDTRRLIQLVRRRRPGVPIVAGGEHITATAEYTLQSTPEVDVCVIGEGEETLVDLADALDRGTPLEAVDGLVVRNSEGAPHRTGPRKRIRRIDEIPWPAWDLIALAPYLDNGHGYGVDRGRSMPILATRGCPYQCTFCSSPAMWTPRWYARDPQDVLDEIQKYRVQYDATNFDFYDLTAIVKKQWILEFAQGILARKMTITWQLPSGTRSEAIDEEVSRLLYASGCRNVNYAPESGSPAVLARIKKVVKLERLEGSVRGSVRAGLNVKLNVIVGFPHESRSEAVSTMRFLVRMALAGVHDVGISLFAPYPGSELHRELRESGRIPALSDKFFLDLLSYKDPSQASSYLEGVSPGALNLLRIFDYLLFYGIQYAVRPWRLAVLLRNLAIGRQESRLEKSIQDFAHRRGWYRRRRPAAGRTPTGAALPLGRASAPADARARTGGTL